MRVLVTHEDGVTYEYEATRVEISTIGSSVVLAPKEYALILTETPQKED